MCIDQETGLMGQSQRDSERGREYVWVCFGVYVGVVFICGGVGQN